MTHASKLQRLNERIAFFEERLAVCDANRAAAVARAVAQDEETLRARVVQALQIGNAVVAVSDNERLLVGPAWVGNIDPGPRLGRSYQDGVRCYQVIAGGRAPALRVVVGDGVERLPLPFGKSNSNDAPPKKLGMRWKDLTRTNLTAEEAAAMVLGRGVFVVYVDDDPDQPWTTDELSTPLAPLVRGKPLWPKRKPLWTRRIDVDNDPLADTYEEAWFAGQLFALKAQRDALVKGTTAQVPLPMVSASEPSPVVVRADPPVPVPTRESAETPPPPPVSPHVEAPREKPRPVDRDGKKPRFAFYMTYSKSERPYEHNPAPRRRHR